MKTTTKRALAIVLGLAVVAVGGAALVAALPTDTRAIGPGAETQPTDQLIAAGRYIATASDCIACHTAPGGKPFAGGLKMATPIGALYSSNITPDKKTGIGNFSLNDFDRAVRHGITPAGGTLYPAMPYPSYAKMTDADLRALYAYFMQGVAPVESANRTADIRWPLSMRWPLALWRKAFAPPVATIPVDRYQSAALARGAYLVQSLGHCGACHTPRATTMQELAQDESSPHYLAGGAVIDGWLAVNLRGDAADGLGRWSERDIADTLAKARNAHAAVVGTPMADVVAQSTQHLTDADRQAMATYLKSLPAVGQGKATFAASEATARALRAGNEENRGAQLYVDNCAACHRTDAKSNAVTFPALAGNPSVLADDPASLIRLVLAGSALPTTGKAPSNLGMPGFAWRLSDEETAQLVTFVRTSWGNQAPAATASAVAKVRKQLDAEHASR
ncbi:cytochrome c [Pseudoduganella flava]|uniref:C-type cytochrome n=1 Tax=Pseudoduganella flava TaxID=871742 RepID=A0A562PIM3_9BURK|nr:cytochrome c [Pseudoduganella flava]QGZ41917.1 c-type cytochrome [Pseudoduganella flava]TWI44325.1 cytochrome c [Pseudoduganella flava]